MKDLSTLSPVFHTAENPQPDGPRRVYYHVALYEPVPEDVSAAWGRIRKAVEDLPGEDMDAVKAWHGNVVLYDPMGCAPTVDKATEQRWLEQASADALARYPDKSVESVWFWGQCASYGVTVELVPA